MTVTSDPAAAGPDSLKAASGSASERPASRNLSLDFLKGVCIILVVFFHNIRLNPESVADSLWTLACHAAVPCFFMASGAVFFSRPLNLKRHIIRIVRTYFVLAAWRAVYLLFYGVYLSIGTGGSLRAVLSFIFVFQRIEGIPVDLFWFMEALLVVLMVAPLLHLCRQHSRPVILYIMAVLFLFNQLLTDGQLLITELSELLGKNVLNITTFAQISPFNLNHSNYLLYFLLGAELMERRDRISNAGTPVLMMVLGLAGLALIKYLQSGLLVWGNTHIVSGYYWISTMALSCGLFLCALRIPVNTAAPLRWFARVVGTSTMGVFCMHLPLMALLGGRLFVRFDPWNGWVVNLAESLLITAIACAGVFIGRKIPLIRHLF